MGGGHACPKKFIGIRYENRLEAIVTSMQLAGPWATSEAAMCVTQERYHCARCGILFVLFFFLKKEKGQNNAGQVMHNTVYIRRRRRDITKSASVPTFLYGDPASLSSVSGSITPRMADTCVDALPPSTPAPLTAQCLQNSLPRDGRQEQTSQGWRRQAKHSPRDNAISITISHGCTCPSQCRLSQHATSCYPRPHLPRCGRSSLSTKCWSV